MYKRKAARLKIIVLGVLLLGVILLLIRCAFVSSDQQIEEVVAEFYGYEQEGDFANSWDLFHSAMKKRFTKSHYIQDRAHVFMNHFGVETFNFKLGELEKLDSWKMAKTGPELKNVYRVAVTQTYKGKYGNFDINQEVFVVEEKGEWKIVWDYNGQ